MTRLASVVKAFELEFVVHDEVGFAVGEYDGPKDMSRAPNGERYVTVTSGGVGSIGAYFVDEDAAIDAWLVQAKRYADADMNKHHLYWRTRPQLVSVSLVAIDQAAAMRHEWLREVVAIDVKFVACRMLVSEREPGAAPTLERKISL